MPVSGALRSTFSTPPEPITKSPVMVKVPTDPVPPGLMVPLLVKAATPVPTIIVPDPDNVPEFVKPAVSVKLVPLATLMVPN